MSSAAPRLRRWVDRRRVFGLSLGASVVAIIVVVGHLALVARRAEVLVRGAEGRLRAPFLEAPGVDRIQASSAAAMLEQAMDLGRDEPAVRGAYHYARAIEDLQRGDLVLAEGELASAHRFLGETAELLTLSAALSRARLLHEQAGREIERALATAPDDPRTLLLAADIALDRGEAERARGHLERLARLVPGSSVVRNRFGIALEAEGALEAAEREFRAAASLDPHGHDALVNVGRILRRLGRHREALEAFQLAVGRAPTDAIAVLGRGLARAAVGDVRGAEQDFRRAAELAPNDAEPLLALGDLQRDLGAIDAAVETYRRAIEREDADAATWLKLGNALALLESYEAAAHAFEAAIRRAPMLAAAHNGLGVSWMHMSASDPSLRDAAVRELERAFELDPSDPNPLMNLALLSERDGPVEAARSAWNRVLAVSPDSTIARRRLARLDSAS